MSVTLAANLIELLSAHGVSLSGHVDQSKLDVDGPIHVLSNDVLERTAELKPDILHLLALRRDARHTCAAERSAAAQMIRQARRDGSHALARTLRDTRRERLATCLCDDDVAADTAEQLALDEMKSTLREHGTDWYDEPA